MVCPSSLVSNWAKEFDKWVGKASQPKRIVIRKGGEEGLQMIKSFVPIKPQKSESTFILVLSYFIKFTWFYLFYTCTCVFVCAFLLILLSCLMNHLSIDHFL